MTQPVSVADKTEQKEAPVCRHHWVIQPATGPISQGVCQICGEAREFKNYVEASTWGDDKSSNRASADVARTVSRTAPKEDEGDE